MLDGLNVVMNPLLLILATGLIAAMLAGIGYQLSQSKAVRLVKRGNTLRSTPQYYGWHTLTLMFIPALLITIIMVIVQIAGGIRVPNLILVAAWIALPALALLPAVKLISPKLNARNLVERVIYVILLSAALVSIFTTLGIVISVLFEALQFFKLVPVSDFLLGTEWSPGGAFYESAGRGESTVESKYGAVPLFAGTAMITFIAMMVAVPIGLLSAICLSEYSPKRVRRFMKPMLEVLAGIPTVVYGFFAAITFAPMVVNATQWVNGALKNLSTNTQWVELVDRVFTAEFENCLAPGVIMGVMIIPFMSSLCDDVLSSVPQNLRYASLALGSTKSEMIKKVILPAALPGIISAFLLSVSRAIGETMIVVMAAGASPTFNSDSWNPLKQMTTVTVHIVQNLTGDLAYDNPQTLSAFALGLTLLVMTLLLNIVSVAVIRKFRQRYEGD